MTVKAGGKTRAPISSHPVFPAIVALWFAALLGFGSMVLPAILLEKIVTVTGVGAVLPAAQPPLGVTARVLIALAAAGLGVILGLVVARKVAAARTAEQFAVIQEQRPSQPSAKRPISALEELGISRLDAPPEPEDADWSAAIPGRKRPLAIVGETAFDEFFDHAPLPGNLTADEPAAETDELDLGAFAEADDPSEDAEPFAGAVFVGPSIEPEAEPIPQAHELMTQPPLEEPDLEEPQMPSQPSLDPLAAAAMSPFAQPSSDPDGAEAAIDQPGARSRGGLAGRPLRDLGMVELVERFALSLQHRAEAQDDPLELPRLRGERAAPQADKSASAVFDRPASIVQPQWAEATVSLGEAEGQPPQPSAPSHVPAIPAALQPIAFDDEDEPTDAEPLSGFALSLDPEVRPFSRPASEAFGAAPPTGGVDRQADETEADDTGGLDDEGAGYSSLLAMKRPFGAGREFVRIDEEDSDAVSEPVIVFPWQHRPAAPASDGPSREPISHPPTVGPGFRPLDGLRTSHVDAADPGIPDIQPVKNADPAETERALRAALEKLQKMSGAA